MPYCPVCKTEIFASKLETISNQTVCSLSCVGLLKSTERDSCHYCQRPVWKDNYYKIDCKYFCSKYCKDKAINQKNILDKSNNIQHFNEYCFFNAKPVSLKNTEKLRDEVLKLYKDFKFDSNENLIIENSPINLKFNNYNSERKRKVQDSNDYLKIDLKKSKLNYTENKNKKHINISKDKIDKDNKNVMLFDGNKTDKCKNKVFLESYETKDLIIKKKYYLTEDKNNYDNSKIFNYKYRNKPQIGIYNQNTFKRNNNKDYTSNNVNPNSNLNKTIEIKKEREEHRIYTNGKAYKSNNFLESNNFIKNYNSSFDFSRENILNNKSNIRNIKSKIATRFDIKKTPICKTCLRKLGNATFMDRNGNRFCSDECKNEFL